ncbi:MAG: sulfatase family protein [Bacteroidota bacterium]
MNRSISVLAALTLTSSLFSKVTAAEETHKSPEKKQEQSRNPNIILFYVDDLGYGDVGCYGAKGVETPNIDRLADNGIKFTNAYCSAATSTPSRYAMLTGSYAFRSGASVLPGDAPMLIDTDQKTLPSMLKEAGYTTGIVGKWHLGLGDGEVDWNEAIKPGPLEVGFDYSFLLPATGDRVPCVWVENHHVVDLDDEDPIRVSYDEKVGNEPTGISHPELLKMGADEQHSGTIINGVSRIGYMAGGHTARWKDELMPYRKLWKAREFMEKNQGNPFFLYFSLHGIHVPRLPNQKFIGETDMGPRGDHIVQVDWMMGQIMEKLEDMGIKENTLVIFTSDNGPVLDDGYDDQAEELLGSHEPAGPFRGGKYSALEAGTRMPTIISWPQEIEPGESDALIGQVDLLASLAALTGQQLKGNEAPDSRNVLPALLGKSDEGRRELVTESWTLSLRQGKWKYIKPGDQPTWIKENKGIDPGGGSEPHLYNLEKDIGETNNVASEYPAKVEEMKNLLEKIEAKGHVRPGVD